MLQLFHPDASYSYSTQTERRECPETSAWGFYFYYLAPNPIFVSVIYLFTYFILSPFPHCRQPSKPPASLANPITATTVDSLFHRFHRPYSFCLCSVKFHEHSKIITLFVQSGCVCISVKIRHPQIL